MKEDSVYKMYIVSYFLEPVSYKIWTPWKMDLRSIFPIEYGPPNNLDKEGPYSMVVHIQ